MKHDLFNLKSQLYDSKAVSENLPHQDLNKLIPFRSDEDMITCLGNADLNNALFSKVIMSYMHVIKSIHLFAPLQAGYPNPGEQRYFRQPGGRPPLPR